MDREYAWFIRDGVFVRSPVKFDGVTLSESDRRKAEDEWIAQEKDRGKQDAAQAAAVAAGQPGSALDSAGRRLAIERSSSPLASRSSSRPLTSCDSSSSRAITPSSDARRYNGRRCFASSTTRGVSTLMIGPGHDADREKDKEQGEGEDARRERKARKTSTSASTGR